jgi:UDP-3-O-[3-hydroxymyristoyl] glucosamine N-acyltransferase
LHTEPAVAPSARGIHPTAIVSAGARLGAGVEIGPYSIVHEGVELGDGCRVGAYCELGLPTALAGDPFLRIGAGANIRSHAVFYAGSTIGRDLETGHRVTVREGTRAGDGLRLGTLCDVQGDCRLGEHVRLHSGVFVAKGSRIGNYVWLMPHVMLANDPTPPSEVVLGCELGDYAVVATRAVLMPGVRVGEHALVAAAACVTRGVPARLIGPAARVRLRDDRGTPAYPWPRHFSRGYPGSVLARWSDLFPKED